MLSTTQEAQECRKKFKAYYYEKIAKDLAAFEDFRKPELVKYQLLMALCVVAVIVDICCLNYFSKLMPVGFWEKNGPGEAIMMVGALACTGFFWLASKIKKDFENRVKQVVLDSFLSFFGDFNWSSSDCVSHAEIEESKLVGNFTKMKHDDYFAGTYKNLGVIISEMKLIRGSGKNQSEIFSGIFVKLEMNKKFNGHTIIVENNPVKGFFAKTFEGEMGKVELEDVEFEKEFDVYSQDQVEARYLITTSFIERFKNLKKTYNSSDVRASFLNNYVTISIPCNKDMFCLADVRKPVVDTGAIQQLFNEFVAVLSLIDLLKLDSKTGL